MDADDVRKDMRSHTHKALAAVWSKDSHRASDTVPAGCRLDKGCVADVAGCLQKSSWDSPNWEALKTTYMNANDTKVLASHHRRFMKNLSLPQEVREARWRKCFKEWESRLHGLGGKAPSTLAGTDFSLLPAGVGPRAPKPAHTSAPPAADDGEEAPPGFIWEEHVASRPQQLRPPLLPRNRREKLYASGTSAAGAAALAAAAAAGPPPAASGLPAFGARPALGMGGAVAGVASGSSADATGSEGGSRRSGSRAGHSRPSSCLDQEACLNERQQTAVVELLAKLSGR